MTGFRKPWFVGLGAAILGWCVLSTPVSADTLELAGGQRLKGRVQAWSGDTLVWDTGHGLIQVQRSAVHAVVLDDHDTSDLPAPLWPTEIAVRGRGFFRVQLPDAVLAYTRNGRFRLDEQGRVVSPEGFPLDPPIQIPSPLACRVDVHSDGEVWVWEDGNAAEFNVGRIQLHGFAAPDALRPLDVQGATYYLETYTSGTEMCDSPRVGSVLGHLDVGHRRDAAPAPERAAAAAPDAGRARLSLDLPDRRMSLDFDVPELDALPRSDVARELFGSFRRGGGPQGTAARMDGDHAGQENGDSASRLEREILERLGITPQDVERALSLLRRMGRWLF